MCKRAGNKSIDSYHFFLITKMSGMANLPVINLTAGVKGREEMVDECNR